MVSMTARQLCRQTVTLVAGLSFVVTALFWVSSPTFADEQTPQRPKKEKNQTEQLRVLSYNIHMWQISVDELAEVVRNADADIVGLNEAWNASHNNALARKLGYNVVYGGQDPVATPAKAHTVNGFYMPQVLLTKHKIVHSQVFNAMAEKQHAQFDPKLPIYRGGTLAVLETAAKKRVVVFVLHLHPWGNGDSEKMTTMRLAEIKGVVNKLQRYGEMPVIILGDFNTRSHLDGSQGWKTTRFLSEQGFHDTFRGINPDATAAPGLTCGEGRIDYIFHNARLAPVESRVVTPGIFGSKGYGHSDHLAIFGVLQFK